MNKLEYSIIEECKTGPEEFFVLVSSINYEDREELNSFLSVLINLVNKGFIQCKEMRDLTLNDLNKYISKRKEANENLDEHPAVVKEYSFETTDMGINQLNEMDKPLKS